MNSQIRHRRKRSPADLAPMIRAEIFLVMLQQVTRKKRFIREYFRAELAMKPFLLRWK